MKVKLLTFCVLRSLGIFAMNLADSWGKLSGSYLKSARYYSEVSKISVSIRPYPERYLAPAVALF